MHIHLRDPSILGMEAAENREGDDRARAANGRAWALLAFWHALVDALVRTRTIEIQHVLLEDMAQVRFAHEQDVIEAFTPHAPQ